MGAGTLVELIARGNQDAFLIGNPQFSYFKSVYKRHTNFAIEPIRQIFNESPDFGKRVSCTIEKKADLLGDILLDIELPALNAIQKSAKVLVGVDVHVNIGKGRVSTLKT